MNLYPRARAAYRAERRNMKRKFIIFLVLAVALLCFAMPAIASPPAKISAIEAFGPVANISTIIAQEYARPVVATVPGIVLYALPLIERISSVAYISILVFAIAAVLAALMSGAASLFIALYKYVGRSRGFADGQAKAPRWV